MTKYMQEQGIQFQACRENVLEVLKKGLSPKLTYHTIGHVLDVEESATRIAEKMGVADEQIQLIRTASLVHDIGFIYTYSGHEVKSCEMTSELLSPFGYSELDIDTICGMIMATRIPQEPKNVLEEILADADLDYLGRGDYEPISDTLFQEMKTYGFLKTKKEWLHVQVNFLRKHHYHTDWSKKHRAPKKAEVLKTLEQQLDE